MAHLFLRKMEIDTPDSRSTKVIKQKPLEEGLDQANYYIKKEKGCVIRKVIIDKGHVPVYHDKDVDAKKGIDAMLSYLEEKTNMPLKRIREKFRADVDIYEGGILTWAESVRRTARRILLK